MSLPKRARQANGLQVNLASLTVLLEKDKQIHTLTDNGKMKKAFITLAALLSLLSACSKDSDTLGTSDNALRASQYIYADKTITAAVGWDGSSTAGITIYENGRYAYQCKAGYVRHNSGAVFEILYGNDMVLICSVSNNVSFSALVDNNVTRLQLPKSMPFRLDASVLDANGDGVLDSWQQLCKFSVNSIHLVITC